VAIDEDSWQECKQGFPIVPEFFLGGNMCSWASDINTAGLFVALLGSAFLVRFGVRFQGDTAGVLVGKGWTKLGLTIEWGQRLGFIMLSAGFILQIIAQFL